MKSKVVFPGSFDPITTAHLDIIKRMHNEYDEITVLIANNPQKKSLFTVDERKQMIEELCQQEQLTRISVDTSNLLVTKYCENHGIKTIVRGLRNVNDFTFEQNIAYNNIHLNPSINTVFYLSKPEHLHIASSGVKEILNFNEDVSHLVPEYINRKIKEKNANL